MIIEIVLIIIMLVIVCVLLVLSNPEYIPISFICVFVAIISFVSIFSKSPDNKRKNKPIVIEYVECTQSVCDTSYTIEFK